MESTSKPGLIQISTALYQALNDPRAFHLKRRGEIEVKGKGTMSTWWLSAKDDHRKVHILPGNAEDMENAQGETRTTLRSSFSNLGKSTISRCPFSRRTSHTMRPIEERSSISEGYESASPSPWTIPEPVPASVASPDMKTNAAKTVVVPSVFDIDVVRPGCTINLSFIPGETTLEEIIESAMPDSGSKMRYVGVEGGERRGWGGACAH